MITISFQPGCVNTTEMDIRKCRRMKNPQKVKKVSLSFWFGFGFVGFFKMQITLDTYSIPGFPNKEPKKVFCKYQFHFVLICEFTIPILPRERYRLGY